MQLHQLLTDAEAGTVPKVVLLSGSERFFIDRALGALRAAVVGEGPRGFNEDVFEGKGQSATPHHRRRPHLADAGEPALHPRARRRGDGAGGAGQASGVPGGTGALGCVVLLAEKLDGRTKLAKRAAKLRISVDASPLKLGDMRVVRAGRGAAARTCA